jgi:MFS family permease
MNRTIWKYIGIFGFNAAAATIIASVYNNYMPIFLQAGHPGFDVGGVTTTLGFGLTPFLAGIVMSIDNVAGFILSPAVGLWSDKLRKRRVFVLASIPLAAIGVILIPVAALWVRPETNGQLALLMAPFAVLMVGAVTVIAATIISAIPNGTLTLELIPSAQRTKAYGVIMLISSAGGLAIFALTGVLYNISRILPFALGAVATVMVGLLYWFFIKDPEQLQEKATEREGGTPIAAILKGIRDLPVEVSRSLWLLLFANFFYQFGVAAFQTFYSSYAINVLSMQEAETIQMGLAFTAGQLLMTVPAGFIAARFGRKRSIMTGLVVFTALSLVIFFFPVRLVVLILTVVLGLCWAVVLVNNVPMLSDVIPGGRWLSTVLGFQYIFVTLSFIVAVPVAGWVVGLFGTNYNMLWLLAAVTVSIALVMLSFVRHGEAKASGIPEPATA